MRKIALFELNKIGTGFLNNEHIKLINYVQHFDFYFISCLITSLTIRDEQQVVKLINIKSPDYMYKFL